MLTIRLQRAGKKNRPDFRIVLAEKTASATKKFTEVLGHYNPRTKEFGIKEDRVKYWIEQHVTLSPTIHNLFVSKDVVKADKIKAFSIPQKPITPAVEAPDVTEASGEAPTSEEQAPVEATAVEPTPESESTQE